MVDGSLNFDTKIDTSGFEKSADKITADAAKTADEVASTVENSADDAKKSVNEAVNEIQQKIDAILNDSERSAKGKAAAIAQVYIKAGLNSSEAFTKAWDAVGRNSPIEKIGSTGKKNSDSFKKSWLGAFKSVKSEAGRTAKTTANDFNSAIVKMKSSLTKLQGLVLSVFSVKALISFAKQATVTAASVNAANSAMSQTFGKLENAATAAINRVADESGILDTRLRSTATGIYAFAKTSGMDSASALGMMEEALQVAADSAAYYDRSLEDTSETLKSFLKGNYANDAALGLSATEYTRNAAAMKLYGKSFQNLSEAQKQLTLLQMVKDANDLSGATGQAAREADGWENVIGNLKEAWKQLIAVIGQPVLKLAIPVVQSMTAALQRLTDYANAAWQALSKVFGWEQVEAISAATDSEKELTKAVEATTEAQEGALAGFDEIQILADKSAGNASADSAAKAVEALAGADQTSGGVLTPTIDTSKLEAGIAWIKSSFESLASWFDSTIKPIFSGMFSDMTTATEPIREWFETDFPGFAETARSTFTSVFSGAVETVSMVLSNLWDILMSLASTFSTAIFPTLAGYGEELMKTFSVVFDTLKGLFDRVWQEGISPFLTQLAGRWDDIWQSVKAAWDKHGQPIFEGIRTAVQKVGDFLVKTWETLIKPVWDHFMQVTDQLWQEHLKPLWDKILDFIGNLVENALIIFNEVIMPIVNKVADYLYPVIETVMNSIIDVISTVYEVISNIVSSVIDIADGLVKFITGAFTDDMDKAFEGLNQMFKGLVNGIISLLEGFCNLGVSALNSLLKIMASVVNAIVDAINSISIDIPDWVPFFGGKSIGFNLDRVSPKLFEEVKIPRLATGTVIPPNKEFLAVLGDQTQGTNVEAPLETIKQAFREALAESGGSSRQMTVVLQVGRRELGRTIVELGREEEQRVGMRIRT